MSHTVASLLQSCALPNIEAHMLLEHALGWTRTALITYPERRVDMQQALVALSLFARRRAGEPVAYLTGEREFYGLMFQVSSAVLIPRPETELLVEQALLRLDNTAGQSVLDLGTGSGAIAVSLASLHKNILLTACDESHAALSIAKQNAQALLAGDTSRIQMIESDWYGALGSAKFDLIVSNPPYIAVADAHLSQGDLRFEPPRALASGNDGLDAIRIIVRDAPRHLNIGGWLLFEHGYDQADACSALLKQAGFSPIFCEKDLAGIPRVSGGRWLSKAA
jgi:release factor glutamine methyltransferase